MYPSNLLIFFNFQNIEYWHIICYDLFRDISVYYSILNQKEVRKVMYEVIVDEEKCIGCGECVDICPSEVYELQDDKSVPVNAEECVGCESCIEVCEQEAITVREIGESAA
jgi:NAD-dependent dihydropyrimidine dehydrogenase PreA subunit